DGAVHLFPAIPDVWSTGTAKGIKARGGFEIDMLRAKNDVQKVTLSSTLGGILRLRSYVPLRGKGLEEAVGEYPNRLLNPVDSSKVIIAEQANLKGSNLKKVYEYDLSTVAGNKYIFEREKQNK